MFWKPRERIKGKWDLFSGYNQRNNACLVYLKCKLQQDSYDWWIFKLKGVETVEITYLSGNRQQTRYHLIYLEFFEERKKVRLIFWTPRQNMKRKFYVFSYYEERNNVCLEDLEFEMTQDSYRWCIFM